MSYNKPNWWALYALLPLMIIGMFLIQASTWAAWMKSIADIALIIFTFGSMALWMRRNEGAITRSEYAEAERARAKLHRQVRATHSAAQTPPQPTVALDEIPLSGFGSARFKPVRKFERRAIAPNRARVITIVSAPHQKEY